MKKIASTCNVVREGWNGFNLLHYAAALRGEHDLGLAPEQPACREVEPERAEFVLLGFRALAAQKRLHAREQLDAVLARHRVVADDDRRGLAGAQTLERVGRIASRDDVITTREHRRDGFAHVADAVGADG